MKAGKLANTTSDSVHETDRPSTANARASASRRRGMSGCMFVVRPAVGKGTRSHIHGALSRACAARAGVSARVSFMLLAVALSLASAACAFPAYPTACRDLESSCKTWADAGECERNVGFMKLHACRHTCDACLVDHQDLAPPAVRATADEQAALARDDRPYGSCAAPPQHLRWGVSEELALRIACRNRKGAEPSGFFEGTDFVAEATATPSSSITFYDSTNPSRALFVAPRNRSMEDFLAESKRHGWPSFRDEELVVDAVRVLRGRRGEVVSVDGTHLGHNLPDARNRYCINLVSVSGVPPMREGAGSVR